MVPSYRLAMCTTVQPPQAQGDTDFEEAYRLILGEISKADEVIDVLFRRFSCHDVGRAKLDMHGALRTRSLSIIGNMHRAG